MKRWWPKVGLKYSHLMHVIPIIFIAAWLWMLGLFIPSPRCSYIVAMVVGLAFMWIVLATLKKVSDSAERARARTAALADATKARADANLQSPSDSSGGNTMES
jgi:uncharacterized membrane protein